MRRAGLMFVVGASVLTLAGGACLWAEIPTVQRWSAWFWPISAKEFDLRVLAGCAVVLPLLTAVIARVGGASRARLALGLTLLIAVGFLFQHGLALAEGRGFDGMRDRIVKSGHDEFARDAVLFRLQTPPVTAWHVFTDYEEVLAAQERRVARTHSFARSKPPGQLLTYMALDWLAVRIMPDPPTKPVLPREIAQQRYDKLVNFAALVLPLLSTLVLIPLALLGRLLLGPQRALWPALLYVLLPPTALVTLHLDQAVYPTLAAALLALAAYAGRSATKGWAWGLGAGGAAWLGLFVSFSLLPAIPLAGVLAWLACGATDWKKRGRAWLLVLAGFAAAFVFLSVTAGLFANYDLFTRFEHAMTNHREWMILTHPDWPGWPDALQWRLAAGALNLIEFGYWLGFAVLLLFVGAAVRGCALACRKRFELSGTGAAATALLLIATALGGGSIGEVARLWIFMLPAVALFAAERLGRIGGERAGLLLHATVACQLVWVCLLKARQDFW